MNAIAFWVTNNMNRKRFFLFVKLLITTGLIYYVLNIVPLGPIILALKETQWSYFIVSFGFLLAICFVEAYNFQLFSKGQGLKLKFLDILEVNFITSFYGQILPGFVAGGVLRWYRFNKLEKKPVEIFTIILFNRAIEVSINAFAGLMALLVLNPSPEMPYLVWFFSSIIALVILCLLLSTIKFAQWRPKFQRVPVLNRDTFWNILDSFSLFSSYPMRLKSTILASGFLKYGLSIAALLFLVKALGISVPVQVLGFTRSFLSIIIVLPISLSGIGVRDLSLVHLLQPFGVLPEDAVSLSFLILASMFLINLLGGFLELRQIFFQRNHSTHSMGSTPE